MAAAAQLTAAEDRARLDALLSRLQGYGVCAGPLKQHLSEAHPHWLCEKLGAYVAYLMSRKADEASIARLMARRHASLCHNPVQRFDLDGRPFKGTPGAPLTLVEFFDFQCWACQRLSGVLEKLLPRFEGQVQLYHKQYPLKSHEGAAQASMAALAAHRQGKYWEMLGLLFVISPEHSAQNILKYAKELRLDQARLEADMAAPEIRQMVVNDTRDGRAAGLKATPTLFLDGRMVDLPDDEYILGDIIEETLRRRRSDVDFSCR